MPEFHRHAHYGGSNPDACISQDLPGFKNQFLLFRSAAILKKVAPLRDDIPVDRVGIRHWAIFRLALIMKLFHPRHSRSAYTLIGGNHNAVTLKSKVQGCQGGHHLDGGTVRIGDKVMILPDAMGIDLRDYQGYFGVFSPGGGIINDVYTLCGKAGCPGQGSFCAG